MLRSKVRTPGPPHCHPVKTRNPAISDITDTNVGKGERGYTHIHTSSSPSIMLTCIWFSPLLSTNLKISKKIQVAKKTSRRKKVPDLTQKERERERWGWERRWSRRKRESWQLTSFGRIQMNLMLLGEDRSFLNTLKLKSFLDLILGLFLRFPTLSSYALLFFFLVSLNAFRSKIMLVDLWG